MANRTIMRGMCSKKLADHHKLFRDFYSPSRCFHGLIARHLKPHRIDFRSQTASTPLAQLVRHCHTPKAWPPIPANRAHDLEDVSHKKHDKTVEATSHDQSGPRTFGDRHNKAEHRKEIDNMLHGAKLLMKEVEVVMEKIDKSRKKKWDGLVKMVDDAQKEIASRRSRDSDEKKQVDSFVNATGDAEAEDEEGIQRDENGRNDLMDEDNDDELVTGPVDLKHRLALLEIKVNVLKMDFNTFRSQENADSTFKSMGKLARLMEKLPRD